MQIVTDNCIVKLIQALLFRFSLSSKHNYVMYAVHNYVCLQISSFGMGIYQQLFTPPMTALVFSTFWAGIGYNFCLKFYHTLLKIRGGS